MAELLALDWQKKEIIGIEGQANRNKCTAKRCFRLPIPEELQDNATPQEVGEWLRAQLATHQVSTKQAIVLLPREEVVVRQLQLPQMPDAELPLTTRLQLATRTAIPVEQLEIDFVPVRSATDYEGRTVVASSVSKRQLQRLNNIAAAADLKLVSAGTSHDGLAAWAHRMELDQRVSLHEPTFVVHIRDHQLDLMVLCDGEVRFTNSAYLPFVPDADHKQELFAEIRRCLMAVSSTTPFSQMARTWIVGAGQFGTSLAIDWAQRMPGPEYTAFQPFDVSHANPASDELNNQCVGTSPLLGALMAHEKPIVARVDFLNPRQPPVQQNKTRLNSLIGIAIAVCLAAGIFFWTNRAKTNLDRQIRLAEQDLAEHQKAVEETTPDWESMNEIAAWNNKNVNWIHQLTVFDELMNERKPNVYLKTLKIKQGSNENVADIDAELLAIDEYSVRHIKDRFEGKGYLVNPREVDAAGKESRFPFETMLDLVLTSKPESPEDKLIEESTDDNKESETKENSKEKSAGGKEDTKPDDEKKSDDASKKSQPLVAPLPAEESKTESKPTDEEGDSKTNDDKTKPVTEGESKTKPISAPIPE